ncbi:MAG: aldo/keto reductase [Candidatus Gracilibacteria bacterium]|jgi:diketogulonate reductase-like aldo/keto reductase|nr:aldo/keto reductase [Candidatus Gracilibacteria bacterium]
MKDHLSDNQTFIPKLGIGTWKIGGKLVPDYTNDQKEIESIQTALRLGLTHIDTAEKYGGGHAEELVGQAISRFDRKKLFLTSKLEIQNLSSHEIREAFNLSLKRLKTDYLDLYLIHEYSKAELEKALSVFDQLVEEGVLRFIGVSNFSVEQIKEAQSFSKHKIFANEIEYNLLTRNHGQFSQNMETEILPFCRENGIQIIAYRPLAKGNIFEHHKELFDYLQKKYQKTFSQIALNWLISKPGVSAIFKSSNPTHIEENLGALGWTMDLSDIEILDNLEEQFYE